MSQTFTKLSLSHNVSQELVKHAFKKAEDIGLNIAVTVVDESGNLKMFSRMDRAPLVATDVSRKKAVTAIGFGIPTGDAWLEFIGSDPILAEGAKSIEDFSMFGGGAPIVVDNQIVGAIGISGGHYKQDEECLHYALEAVLKS